VKRPESDVAVFGCRNWDCQFHQENRSNSTTVSEIAFEGAIPLKLSEGYKKLQLPRTETDHRSIAQAAAEGPLQCSGLIILRSMPSGGVATPKLLSYEGLWGSGKSMPTRC